MSRAVKVKATRVPVRKSALSASAATRRAFPAWIEADAAAVTFSAAVTKRVRDSLVLRTVTTRKPAGAKGSTHGPGAK
jgi:hypothetical protein